jgi:hypothetical protein
MQALRPNIVGIEAWLDRIAIECSSMLECVSQLLYPILPPIPPYWINSMKSAVNGDKYGFTIVDIFFLIRAFYFSYDV